MNQDSHIGPISRIVEDVLLSYKGILDKLTGDDEPAEAQPVRVSINRVATRFKMWVDNLGAHQSGCASLDYRLKDSFHIQEQIIYLLKDITESLRSVHEILRSETSQGSENKDEVDVETTSNHPDITGETSKPSGVDEKSQTDRGETSSGPTTEKEVTSTEPKLRFKDAIGRKFSFPMHVCATWQDMENLIKQAFRDVDLLGPHVMEGRYNLVGPDGEIIPPDDWEEVIQPGWLVTMRMWPLDRLVDAITQTAEPEYSWTRSVEGGVSSYTLRF